MNKGFYFLFSALLLLSVKAWSEERTIIPFGKEQPWEMKYSFQNSFDEPAPEDDANGNPWYAVNYDDSSWGQLTGPISRDNRFGESYYPWEVEGSGYFLRMKFYLDQIPENYVIYTSIVDDHSQVYINGSKIEGFEDLVDGQDYFNIPSSLLVVGENTLAVWAYDDGMVEAYFDFSIITSDVPTLFTDEEGVNYLYSYEDNSYAVCGWNENHQSSITIKSELNGYPVTKFRLGGYSEVDNLFIPASITAYEGATPKVGKIVVDGNNPVYDSRWNGFVETSTNTLLLASTQTDINDLEGVEAIGNQAFEPIEMQSPSFKCPSTLKRIGDCAFSNKGLKVVELNEGLEYIESCAFLGNELTYLYIPSSVKGVSTAGWNSFEGNPQLTKIEVAEDNPVYTSANGSNCIIGKNDSILYSGCKTTTIPSWVKTINTSAFSNMGLTGHFEIPEGVEYIGWYSISGNSSLTSATLPSTLEYIDGNALSGCPNFTDLYCRGENPADGFVSYYQDFIIAENATLHVPSGCIMNYLNAECDGWTKFKQIVDEDGNTYERPTDISQQENIVYIEPTEARCGSQVVLSLKMKNSVDIQTIQFDLYLPDVTTVVPNEDNELITASKARINKFNYFQSSMQTDGAIRLLAQATKTNVPAGDGEICQVVIDVPEDLEEGYYPMIIKNTILVEQDNTSHSPDSNSVKSNLIVLKYVLGDANNDGDVNAIDFNMIGNYILGQEQTNFKMKAADISGDGEVNAIDFNMVGNMILSGGSASAREKTTETTQDPD